MKPIKLALILIPMVVSSCANVQTARLRHQKPSKLAIKESHQSDRIRFVEEGKYYHYLVDGNDVSGGNEVFSMAEADTFHEGPASTESTIGSGGSSASSWAVNGDSCDNIILKDGSEIEGKVIEIGVDEIRYKRCSHLDGPTIVLKKSDVFLIQYANGTRDKFTEEVIKKPQENVNQRNNSVDNRSNPVLKAMGWLFWIVGFITVLFVSILVGALIILIGLVILLAA